MVIRLITVNNRGSTCNGTSPLLRRRYLYGNAGARADPASVIQSCARLVKSGGWVFFSTLNRNPKSYLYAIIGAEYILRLLPRGTHEYAKFIKPSELAHMARSAGLMESGIVGMTYNPITKVYALEADTSVNYIMAFRA